ncbi:MAG: amidohydrolase [Caldilinea sp.]|nr:amidohydrolase [Caldilinea sp.]MCB0039189.1 amidohydrolase [Caldilinea sp.]MCB0049600.1 amidohydrolase [Caldilinea sp.]MCB0133853.1 amidohydrolase [Caldilineaceae bacterium]MCB0148118.1 amidohydrolase [Caldilineaceae bacterium]
MTDITIFQAKKIITMNPSNPEGTHIAVREGRILGVGSLEDVAGWGAYELDDAFKDNVLIPGFVEAHGHIMEGAFWAFPYVGYFDRLGADGTMWKGCTSTGQVMDALKRVEAQMSDPDAMLLAWGLDPLYFPGERMSKVQLDQVSATRPIFVMHASGHMATVNSAMLQKCKITKDSGPGVVIGADGEPNGELHELSGMALAKEALGTLIQSLGTSDAIWHYGYSARNNGVTTISEMGAAQTDDDQVIETLKGVVNDDKFPARLVVTYSFGLSKLSVQEQAKRALALVASDSDKLRFAGVKFLSDGSNQGFTGQSLWPGYYKGEDQGQWNASPEQIKEGVLAFHCAGIQIHCHCNGNLAVEMFIDAVDNALQKSPRWDHRHTVDHCQTATQAQFRRIKALDMCVNLFANHIYFWGDQHRDLVFGPERAAGMNACATALRQGIPFSIHCDCNVTPLGGLLGMWSAVNRVTASGKVLGAHERISAYDALHAVTLGGAYLLKLDSEVGSLECGKRADFAVLAASPLEVDPIAIKDIPIWGTVVGGVIYANKAAGSNVQ